MRFSRHAQRNMRQWGITAADLAEAIVREEGWISRDSSGNIRVHGVIHGRSMRIVIAADDPGFVITIHERRGDAT